MSIEFRDVTRNRVVIVNRAIFLKGEEVGEIKDRGETGSGSRYHAVFRVGRTCCGVAAGLAQGHGETEIEAVEDAFASAKKEAKAYLASVELLEQTYLEEN